MIDLHFADLSGGEGVHFSTFQLDLDLTGIGCNDACKPTPVL